MKWTDAALGVAAVAMGLALTCDTSRALAPCNVSSMRLALEPTHLSVDGQAWAWTGSGQFTSDAGVTVSVGGALEAYVTDDPNSAFVAPACVANARRLLLEGLTNPLTGASGSSGFEAVP